MGAATTVESQAQLSSNLLTMASLIFNNPHHLRLFLSCERFRLSSDFFSPFKICLIACTLILSMILKHDLKHDLTWLLHET